MGDKLKPGDKLPDGWSKKISRDPLDEKRAGRDPLAALKRAIKHGAPAGDDLTPPQRDELARQNNKDERSR